MGIKFKTLEWFIGAASYWYCFSVHCICRDGNTQLLKQQMMYLSELFFVTIAISTKIDSPKRQLDSFLGSGSGFSNSFPENEIARDAELVNTLYRDVLTQQSSNDPYLRTPDLPNPYDSSLLMSPRLNGNKLKVGTEFRFETVHHGKIRYKC